MKGSMKPLDELMQSDRDLTKAARVILAETSNQVRMMTPAESAAAGWCPYCGCGNDARGYGHAALCHRPYVEPTSPVEKPEAKPPRFAIWSDGELHIERNGRTEVFSRDEAMALLAFLRRTMP